MNIFMNEEEKKRFNEKMKLMAFLDHARWKSDLNYDKPNMFDKRLLDEDAYDEGEQALLTHFLGYITDRQTPFETIFEKLDYIFSQLVHDYIKENISYIKENISVEDDLLDLNENEKSYFIKLPDKIASKEDKTTKVQYTFRSHQKPVGESCYPQITEELKNGKDIFYATSRFYPTDYVAIYSVLKLLGQDGQPWKTRSFIGFIKWAINKDPNNGLESLLYALWLLGYYNIGQWVVNKEKNKKHLKSDFQNDNQFKKINKRREELFKEFKVEGLNSKYYKKTFKRETSKNTKRFHAKRVMCFVRDLFKFKPYSVFMRKLLGDEKFNKLYEQIPEVLELPGDTWNNNERFKKCLCGNIKPDENIPMNVFIRQTYDKLIGNNQKPGCYPEQFDCTFNYVPRMCEISGCINCEFCPIKQENMDKHWGKLHIDERLCHREGDKFCPFLLFAAGFKVKCQDMRNVCPNWPR